MAGTAMRYLGGIRGQGTLAAGDQTVGAAEYDIDGFANHTGEIVGSGELRMAAGLLGLAFGRRDLRLTTADGHVLELRLSGSKDPGPHCEAVHIDVISGLTMPRNR